jgi:hypothetical protein
MSGKPGMKEEGKKGDEPKRFQEEVILSEKEILRNRLLNDRDNMKEVRRDKQQYKTLW